MADNKPQEDAIISRLRPAPGQAPVGVTSYVGLLGKSANEGYWLLYPTLDMGQWVEINEADIVHSEQLPADRSPFGSLGGTQVFVKQNATVTTSKTVSQSHSANEPPDEFDLDVQLGSSAVTQGSQIAISAGGTCDTCRTECGTSCPPTCITCATRCKQNTCANTCANTCQVTCANTCQPTCANTCQPTCANTCAATCKTCNTDCGQLTCKGTCQTCRATICGTCGPPNQCV